MDILGLYGSGLAVLIKVCWEIMRELGSSGARRLIRAAGSAPEDSVNRKKMGRKKEANMYTSRPAFLIGRGGRIITNLYFIVAFSNVILCELYFCFSYGLLFVWHHGNKLCPRYSSRLLFSLSKVFMQSCHNFLWFLRACMGLSMLHCFTSFNSVWW